MIQPFLFPVRWRTNSRVRKLHMKRREKGSHLTTDSDNSRRTLASKRANPEHAYGHSNGTGVRYRFHTGGVCRPSSDAESRTVTINLR